MPSQPAFAQAITYAINRLRTELQPHLTYHNLWHTQHDVMPAAMRLGRLSGIEATELKLLEVAAAYHDLGFVERRQEHEVIGSRIAAEVLPDYSFSPGQIDEIIGMIMATRLPQSPRHPLERILADADLDVLGRKDFFDLNQRLRQELVACGEPATLQEWLEGQLHFMRQHTYCTPEARALREAGKQKHILLLEKQLKDLSTPQG